MKPEKEMQNKTAVKTAGTTEAQRAILKHRAVLLANEAEQTDPGRVFLEVIEFRMGKESYGLETKFVREVFPLKDFTVLPGVPLFILGITNVRGKIMSVVDLKYFLNIPSRGLAELNKIIIIGNEKLEFGILADSVAGTRRVSEDGLNKSLLSGSKESAEYIKGVTEGLLAVLDAEKILNDPAMIIDQRKRK